MIDSYRHHRKSAGFGSLLLAGTLVAVASAGSLRADELETAGEDLDEVALSVGEQRTADALGDNFEGFAGSPENADNLISALRRGDDIVLTGVDEEGFEVETRIENSAGAMGFGNAFISAALAEELLIQQGLEPTPENLQAVFFGTSVGVENPDDPDNPLIEGFDGVLTLRQSGMGWGEIGKVLGFKVGPVISAIRSARDHLPKQSGDLTVEKSASPQQQDRPSKLDKPVKPEKLAKPERPEKLEKPEKPEKFDKPEKPDRPGNQ